MLEEALEEEDEEAEEEAVGTLDDALDKESLTAVTGRHLTLPRVMTSASNKLFHVSPAKGGVSAPIEGEVSRAKSSEGIASQSSLRYSCGSTQSCSQQRTVHVSATVVEKGRKERGTYPPGAIDAREFRRRARTEPEEQLATHHLGNLFACQLARHVEGKRVR